MAKKAEKRSKYYNEDVELDYTYRKTTGKFEKKVPKKKRKRGNGLIIAICILVPILLLGAAACYFFMPQLGTLVDNGLILENVSIAGIDVGGLTKEAAIEKVNQSLAGTLLKEPLRVDILDQQIELTPEVAQLQLDVEAAVDAAYAFGRTGSSVQRKEEKLLAATTGLSADLGNYLTVNETAIAAHLDSLEIASAGDLTESTWEITGTAPDLHAAEAPVELQTLVLTKGTPGYVYDQQALIQQILDAYKNGVSQLVYNCGQIEPEPIDLDAIYAESCNEPTDAKMDQETFEVAPHTFGYQFDLQAAKQGLAEADYGAVLEFPFTITPPAVLEADMASELFQDVLSSYTSYQSSSDNRITNMKIACEAINGTVLLPGDVFDFNDVVGERTPEKGYKPAPSYSGSETVLTYGGGICQPSSTIYYCALMADMEILERACHTYASVYVPYGMDATVNWETLNFKFRNNSEYPVRIDASADSAGYVYISLVGTDTKDYYIKMEYEFIGGYEPEEKIVTMTQEKADEKGYRDGQVITSPIWGSKVQTYKLKYNKADDSLIEKTEEAISVYSKRDKEIVQIIDTPTEESPTEPEETPTDPPAEDPTDPPAEDPTDPPAEESTDPPVEESTDPPVEESTDPPAEESADPPAEESADPPAESSDDASAEG